MWLPWRASKLPIPRTLQVGLCVACGYIFQRDLLLSCEGLRTELEDKLRDSEQRERAGTAADEQSEAKEKKLVSLKENCDR